MKRVLVTGGAGFVGSQALPQLIDRGYEVHAVHLCEVPDGPVRVHWHGVDLLDPAQTSALVDAVRPTHLLHLAWYAEPGEFWTSQRNLDWVGASLQLLRRFSDGGGERAVLAGSCAEYGWNLPDWDGICHEDTTPLAPVTLYGTCKQALHQIGAAWAAPAGVSLCWGRIFFLYGPAEDPRRLVSSVARALLRGESASVSEGSQRRDFLHSHDVAGAFVTLLDSDATGAINIGSGDAVAIREVVALIAQAAGRPDWVEYGTVPTRPGEPPVLQADVRKLRETTGWSPSLSLERGIEQVVEWWRARV